MIEISKIKSDLHQRNRPLPFVVCILLLLAFGRFGTKKLRAWQKWLFRGEGGQVIATHANQGSVCAVIELYSIPGESRSWESPEEVDIVLIYLNLSELNIKFLIKHSRSVTLTGKLIEIKKPPENLLISPQGT